jgi:hypothetical protein
MSAKEQVERMGRMATIAYGTNGTNDNGGVGKSFLWNE